MRALVVVLGLCILGCGGGDEKESGPVQASGGKGGAGTGGTGTGGTGSGGAGGEAGSATTGGWGVESCESAPSSLPSGPTFYVDPEGDDENPGSESAPWRTIEKANQTLVAGDTVIVRSGTYAEVIRPGSSGSSASERITYLAELGGAAIITGGSDTDAIVELSTDFVTVDGFSLKQANPHTDGLTFADVAIWGSGNEVKNCSIDNALTPKEAYDQNIEEIGIGVFSGTDNLVSHNSVKNTWIGALIFNPSLRTTLRCNSLVGAYKDALHFESRKGVMAGDIVERNDLGESYISDGIQFNGDFDLPPEELATDTSSCGVVIRRNKIFGNAENAVDLKGTCHILVEDNLMFGNVGDNNGESTIDEYCSDTVNDRCGGMAVIHGTGTSARDNILRRNVVYDNSGGLWGSDSWRIYNNTIVANNRDFTGPSSSYQNEYKPGFLGLAGSGIFKNNLIGNHNHAETWVNLGSEEIDGNFYFHTEATDPLFAFGAEPWEATSFSEWQSMLDGGEAQSLVGLPSFVAVPDFPTATDTGLDFRLNSDSPAIDRAVALSSAVGDGSGSEIQVLDAGYFFDGFGVTEGDLIRIGSNPAVRIVLIDYENQVITLESDVSWQDGDPVTLDYAGQGLDIGALETE